MAHTPRKTNERRRHPEMFPIGTPIGMYAANGDLMKGTVYSHDQGGWIYTNWPGWNLGVHGQLPNHMRSTNVFKLES